MNRETLPKDVQEGRAQPGLAPAVIASEGGWAYPVRRFSAEHDHGLPL
jgi:hypothetical protein